MEKIMEEEDKILKLQKQVDRLKKAVKKQNYGLVWMDIPEAFEDDVENKLPILKEVTELAIKNDNGKPIHILIEGDNYHALTCLNYTHKGKIDIIYIDPPYNTGSDGFRYKDKRIINKFPDGTEVPTNHPFRHSYWLSFMRKRLELSLDLLKDQGIIFISIDENEFAQLKLLCDEIFCEKSLCGIFVWQKKYGGGNDSKQIATEHEYVLSYYKDYLNKEWLEEHDEKYLKRYKEEDDKGRFFWDTLERPGLKNPIEVKIEFEGKTYTLKTFRSQNTVNEDINNGEIRIVKIGEKISFQFKQRLKIGKKPRSILQDKKQDKKNDVDDERLIKIGSNASAKAELRDIFHKDVFDNPKPTTLISYLISITGIKNGIVLDFFAGSGTTAHSVMQLNEDKKTNIQAILCTNDENKICTEVCYPRIKKVIEGYEYQKSEKVEGLNNSLRYYKTSFVGKNNIIDATDDDKVELAHNAGALLAIAENTLDLVHQNNYYQLFEESPKKRYTAIYFREELEKLEEFVEMVKRLQKKTTVYVFSWGNEELSSDFAYLKDVKIKTIPRPILEIYKNIYNLG